MKTESRVCLALLLLAIALLDPSAHAQEDAGRKGNQGQIADASTPPRAKAIAPGATMPAGHLSVSADNDGADTPVDANDRPGAGRAMAEPLQDGAVEDAKIPPGTIELHVADGSGKPLGKTEVTLGVIYNSVAKGESRKRLAGVTNDEGTATFKDLDTGSGVAYRPMVLKDGATFSASPFQLGTKGIRALLHVYPVTNDLSQTLVVAQTMVYAEVKDDRIQIQQAFKFYNFGANAWVPPPDMVIALPENYTAFASQQGMTDVGVDAVPNKSVRIRGTFAPGQHVIEFKWQLKYEGDASVSFGVGVPPHLAAARIITPASKGMGMDVDGFDPTKTTTDGMGQRALVTEKQLRREDPPLTRINVTLKGLPTEGPGKFIAAVIALCGLGVGLALGRSERAARDEKQQRRLHLDALRELELGHRSGAIGPKTYERARRELIDAVARTFAIESRHKKPVAGGVNTAR